AKGRGVGGNPPLACERRPRNGSAAGREALPMPSEGRRVLVVEDEPLVVDVLQRYLQREGFAVAIARDGRAALQEVQRTPPDLVILDLMLPAVNGLEVCRMVRNSSPVPILMLTARGEEADKIQGLQLGADDYVVKPFSP